MVEAFGNESSLPEGLAVCFSIAHGSSREDNASEQPEASGN